MLSDVPSMCDIYPWILHHHERFDGRGYPTVGAEHRAGGAHRSRGRSFDATTTHGPYRAGLGAEAAIAELLRGAGTQFDHRCVSAFVQLVSRGEIVPPPRAAGEVRFAQRMVIERLRAIRR